MVYTFIISGRQNKIWIPTLKIHICQLNNRLVSQLKTKQPEAVKV